LALFALYHSSELVQLKLNIESSVGDSTSFAVKCFYWERRLGDTLHWRLSSPKQNKVYHSHL